MIVDTPWNTSSKLARLREKGVVAILRYYNYANSSKLPEKRLELAEATAIRKAGIKIGVVFQQRQNDPADFSVEKGVNACRRAVQLARNIDQPAGSTIYFAVDNDFVKASHLDAVAEFFRGVSNAMSELAKAERYAIGAYGSGKVLASLLDKKLIDHAWLAQSTGWSGYKGFRDSKRWRLLQGPVTKVGGLDCDTNTANGSFGEFA